MNFALPVMAISAWAGLAAMDPDTGASWVGGVAALSLLTIAIGFNIRQYNHQSKDIRQIQVEKAQDKRECNWQISVLAAVLEQHAIPMPANFWDVPKDPILKVQQAETDRRRRMFKFRYEDHERAGENESGMAAMSFVGVVLMVCAFFVIMLFVANTLIIQPIEDIKSQNETSAESAAIDRCSNSITADFFVAIKRALAAPPAPSAERAAAVIDLNVTAERIRNRATICADGKPDAYTPTPASSLSG